MHTIHVAGRKVLILIMLEVRLLVMQQDLNIKAGLAVS